MNFERNSYDAIWACASCVHIDDDYIPSLFREFKRVVKPGGILGITLMVGNKSAIEQDNRFFQGYNTSKDFIQKVFDNECDILEVKQNLLRKNTHDIKKVTNWCTYIIKTPMDRKKIINISS